MPVSVPFSLICFRTNVVCSHAECSWLCLWFGWAYLLPLYALPTSPCQTWPNFDANAMIGGYCCLLLAHACHHSVPWMVWYCSYQSLFGHCLQLVSYFLLSSLGWGLHRIHPEHTRFQLLGSTDSSGWICSKSPPFLISKFSVGPRSSPRFALLFYPSYYSVPLWYRPVCLWWRRLICPHLCGVVHALLPASPSDPSPVSIHRYPRHPGWHFRWRFAASISGVPEYVSSCRTSGWLPLGNRRPLVAAASGRYFGGSTTTGSGARRAASRCLSSV